MYKKGSYVSFMTKDPEFHLNEMFGYNDLTEEDFEKTEHLGFIMSVIDDKTYVVVTVRPLECFHCIVDDTDILHLVDESELTPKERKVKALVGFTHPNVYYPQKEVQGDTPKEKCERLAKEAMTHLFPEDEIASVEFRESDFLKADLLNTLQHLFELFLIKGRDAELEDACNEFEKMLKTMPFKEHYTVIVGVYDHGDKGSILNYMVAIDLNFEEITIMRNIDERTHFFRSLGPNFDHIYNWKLRKTRELLTIDKK